MKRMRNPAGIPGVLMLIQNPKKRKHRNPKHKSKNVIEPLIFAGLVTLGVWWVFIRGK